MITQQYLLDRFDYNPDTGLFKRKLDGFVFTYTSKTYGYIHVTLQGKSYCVHRLIWCMITGSFPEGEVDHINQDRFDNRWSNLRDVPKAANQKNKAKFKNNTTGVTGVYWDKQRQKWRAAVKKDGRLYRVGRFSTIEEAELAIKAKRKELGFPDTHGG